MIAGPMGHHPPTVLGVQFGLDGPHALDWLTVMGYAIATALAFRSCWAARVGHRLLAAVDPVEARNQRSSSRLWLLIAVTLTALTLNSQLDVQSVLIQSARESAVSGGWYDVRRRYQTDFIVTMAGVCLAITLYLTIALRRVFRRVFLAVAGMGMLVAFTVIRAASLHNVDMVLAMGGRLRVNRIIELSGIGLMIGAALLWGWSERRHITSSLGPATGPPAGPTTGPMTFPVVARVRPAAGEPIDL